MSSNGKVIVIGAGLSGTEAAWQMAKRGVRVLLKEMKPLNFSPAHRTPLMAELVCSNSFRSDDSLSNAVGVLHEELRKCGSLLMQAADATRVPAGAALAVDREAFANFVTEKINSSPFIEVQTEEVNFLPMDDCNQHVIVATGPLTSESLSKNIEDIIGNKHLHFFDAIAPVVYADTVDMSKAWRQSRWDKGDTEGGDYINCPLSKEEYYAFVQDLLEAEKVEFTEWEKQTPYFDGCLPIEVMAERGPDTLAFGPMKPIGLSNPHGNGEKDFAVVQLRNDNISGSLLNIVGFQTKMKWSEQKRIFRKIRGLENAEFARFGSVHRNTFINSPMLLTDSLSLRHRPNIRFAGQITGCEGYVESIATGFLAGVFTVAEIIGKEIILPPEETAMGSILRHVTKGNAEGIPFQPSNINFGLFPELEINANMKKSPKGKMKKEMQAMRALTKIDLWREKIA